MRVLVGWDIESEIELLSMYLQVADNEPVICRTADELLERFENHTFDVVLLPITFPLPDDGFAAFERLRDLDPHLPILVAARPGEIYPLSRLIRHGLQSHIYRDGDGEYLFLLQTMLESTLAGKRAERARELSERLRQEIDSVRKLQESIIPRDLKAPEGYQIAARYEPAQIRMTDDDQPIVLAGGDYYHAYHLGDERLILLVGDASGHGMKACMSIISMHTMITQLHHNFGQPPHEFVTEINRRLCANHLVQGDGGFITLLYGILDHGVFHWTSAGHSLPLLQDLETGRVEELGTPKDTGGPPLAVFEDSDYETMVTPIPRGHRLMVYTDGIAEAFPDDAKPRLFGLDGIRATLQRCRDATVSETVSALFDDSFAFTHGSGRHDDTSVLLVDRLP